MNFNEHYGLIGKHAFLSPSQYHWVNYDEDKLKERYLAMTAKERGIELHALAETCIRLGIKLARNKNTLNQFVNDAIGFKMTPEQPLYYSDNCFGTADAISFRKNFLRIHDLKTGAIPASMTQLMVYASLFCLEYGYSPEEIDMELRIYQSNDVIVEIPEPEDISEIMHIIVAHDRILSCYDEATQQFLKYND